MALGSNIGRTFLFGESSPSFATANAQQVGGVNPAMDDMVGEALDGLQQTENLTREYYVQWANMKNFAKNIWKNYEIDVTNPNPESEEEIKLHQMFLKNVAALKTLGNNLQRGRENEVAIMKGQMANPNIVRTPQANEFTTAQDFVNTGLTQEDKILAQRVGRSVRSVQERDALNTDRDNYVSGLLAELETTQDEGQQLALAERINALRNVSATYDPTADRDRFSRDLYKRDKKKGNQAKVNEIRHLWVEGQQDALVGSGRILEQMQAIENVVDAQYVTKKDRAGRDKMFIQVELDEPGVKGNKIVDIDMNDNVEGLRAFASIFTMSPNFKEIKVDTISMPPEYQGQAAGQQFFGFVDALRGVLQQKDERGRLTRFTQDIPFVGAGQPEFAQEINAQMQSALQQGMVMPRTELSDGGERITNIEFFTGARTGDPHLNITYVDSNGETENKDFDVTESFLDDFIANNATDLFRAQSPGQQQQFTPAPLPEGITESMIEANMKAHGRSREEVIRAIKKKMNVE